MKFSLGTIAALLLMALVSMALDSPLAFLCCKWYSGVVFPRNIVADYYHTDGDCNLVAVVFIFKNGKQGCANPRLQWVKNLMEYLDQKEQSSTG